MALSRFIIILLFEKRNLVISTKEKSPQVAPQREVNLCRVSRGDFSFVEMTKTGVKKEANF